MAACKIVIAEVSLRCTLHLAGSISNQQTTINVLSIFYSLLIHRYVFEKDPVPDIS